MPTTIPVICGKCSATFEATFDSPRGTDHADEEQAINSAGRAHHNECHPEE